LFLLVKQEKEIPEKNILQNILFGTKHCQLNKLNSKHWKVKQESQARDSSTPSYK
jgi:hypothetical protein